MYPSNIYIPIAHVFTTFLKKLSEWKNLLLHPLYKTFFKKNLFDFPKVEQSRIIENNSHQGLTTDIHQIQHVQYHFFFKTSPLIPTLENNF